MPSSSTRRLARAIRARGEPPAWLRYGSPWGWGGSGGAGVGRGGGAGVGEGPVVLVLGRGAVALVLRELQRWCCGVWCVVVCVKR
jgi:hypothetical protein